MPKDVAMSHKGLFKTERQLLKRKTKIHAQEGKDGRRGRGFRGSFKLLQTKTEREGGARPIALIGEPKNYVIVMVFANEWMVGWQGRVFSAYVVFLFFLFLLEAKRFHSFNAIWSQLPTFHQPYIKEKKWKVYASLDEAARSSCVH
eukprot:1157410-Pelagomonas_calceolata.AAC.12